MLGINQALRAPDVLICLILGGLRNILHAHDSMYVLNARYVRDAAFVRTRDSRRGIVVATTCAVTGLRGGYKVARRMSNRHDIDIREEWNGRGEYLHRWRRGTVISRGFEEGLKICAHTRAFSIFGGNELD